MTPRFKAMLAAMHHYNAENLAREVFALDPDTVYDALVVAPSFTPMKLVRDGSARITVLRETSYTGGYLVEKDGLRLAWIKTASSASNCIDHLAVCGELSFKKLIFTGAVGALTPNWDLGDFATPLYSISGGYAPAYLKESIRDFVPFERVEPDMVFVDRVVALARASGYDLRKAPVFCTDSIIAEYSHLDEIRSFGAELIEMETAAFYRVAALMEVPAVALLVVSDNSAAGIPLLGRDDEGTKRYHRAREKAFPDLIFKIASLN